MVSKRNFFNIMIMMATLLFLFQFSMVIRAQSSSYDHNNAVSENPLSGQDAWQQAKMKLSELTEEDDSYVLFVGDAAGGMGQAVSSWCTYRKKNIIVTKSMTELTDYVKLMPEMIVLESESYALEGASLKKLEKLEKEGVIIVFGSLEDVDAIRNNSELMDFLGIQSIAAKEKQLTGAKLFEGFLLGGEEWYQTSKNDKYAEEKQDLDLTVPWYQIGSGTKAYMVGLIKEKTGEKEAIRNEDVPSLIWRNGIDNGSVFAVCGDYMKDSTAIGILDGMMAEANTYYIYPVVNAQNLAVVNFPELSDVNNDEMQNLYSRSSMGLQRDVLWPALISAMDLSHLRVTAFLHREDTKNNDSDTDTLHFYLRQLKEQNGEAGILLDQTNTASLQSYLASSGSQYQYGAFYTEDPSMAFYEEQKDQPVFENIRTLMCPYSGAHPVLSYYNDDVTLQEATSDGVHYTFSDDIRMRSIQSALGYTGIVLDLSDVFWPNGTSDGWEVLQERLTSNLRTYWKKFSCFDSTTLSESDQRVRKFLNMNYEATYFNKEIVLKTTQQDSWFVLRTHDAPIQKISGGTWSEIEKDAYLIHCEDDTVVIELKGDASLYPSKD